MGWGMFDFFFFLNRPGYHKFQKITSEDRIDSVPAGCKMPGFEFIAFNPSAYRPGMFMEKCSCFFYCHDIIHLSYSIAQSAREIFLQHRRGVYSQNTVNLRTRVVICQGWEVRSYGRRKEEKG